LHQKRNKKNKKKKKKKKGGGGEKMKLSFKNTEMGDIFEEFEGGC